MLLEYRVGDFVRPLSKYEKHKMYEVTSITIARNGTQLINGICRYNSTQFLTARNDGRGNCKLAADRIERVPGEVVLKMYEMATAQLEFLARVMTTECDWRPLETLPEDYYNK